MCPHGHTHARHQSKSSSPPAHLTQLEDFNSSGMGGPEKWGEKSTATRIRIARIIAESPGVSVREIAAALDINTSAVERHMAAMRNVGALERVGSPKGGHWKLTE